MIKYLPFLLSTIISLKGFTQIITPQIKANFGIEADLSANFYNNGLLPSTDDWFRNVSLGTGRAVIDTNGAAGIVRGYYTNPASRKLSFNRIMAFPAYSIINNQLMLDAVYHRDFHGVDSTVFGSGSNKNGMSPANWASPGPASIPDKNDILDAMVHVRRAGPNARDSLWMFAGLSLENVTGNRFFDFELYQTDIAFNPITRNFSGYGPNAGHTVWEFDAAGNIIRPGDIIFTAEFSSSSLTRIEARIWVRSTDLSRNINAFNWGGQFDGASNGAQYGYASILPKTAGAFFSGLQSAAAATWAGPFMLVRDNDALVTSYIPGQFMELAINLSKLGIEPADFANSPCGSPFRRVLIKTRSSTSFTSELKDFVAPFRLFNYEEAEAHAFNNHFCGVMPTIPIYVSNPNPNSIYTWSTTNGNIVGSNTGDTVYINAPGTYYVSQQLHSQCSFYSSDSVVITFDPQCGILNLHINNLTVSKEGNLNKLQWEVINNELLSNYEIEISTNNRTFSTIYNADVRPQQGNTSYQFSQINSQNITSPTYYRIKAIDITGQIHYSNTAILRNTKWGNFDAIVFPNPTKGELFLSYNNSATENVDARILDIYGRQIKKVNISLKSGDNIYKLPSIGELPKGTYIIYIPAKNGTIIQRIILN